jgi:hypothetical protein
VVESTRLESERTGNRTVGSNPTLSASIKYNCKKHVFALCLFRATILGALEETTVPTPSLYTRRAFVNFCFCGKNDPSTKK